MIMFSFSLCVCPLLEWTHTGFVCVYYSSGSAESRVETGLDELVPVSHEATNKCNLKIFVSDNSRFLVPKRLCCLASYVVPFHHGLQFYKFIYVYVYKVGRPR